MDSIIEILQKVRERGHDVHLHILGGIDDSDYGRRVRGLAEQFREWVFLEGWTLGDRKRELLAGHRFGIHARPNEPFGIAVAEMVQTGCVVFVASGGGQVEIVNHPALIYENVADAVEKIIAVLTSEAEQEKLRNHLRQGSNSYSVKTFVDEMRRVVAEFIERQVSAH